MVNITRRGGAWKHLILATLLISPSLAAPMHRAIQSIDSDSNIDPSKAYPGPPKPSTQLSPNPSGSSPSSSVPTLPTGHDSTVQVPDSSLWSSGGEQMSRIDVPGALRELSLFSKEKSGKVMLIPDWQGRPPAAQYDFDSSSSSDEDYDGTAAAHSKGPRKRQRTKPPSSSRAITPQTHAGQFKHENPASRHSGFVTEYSGSGSDNSSSDDDNNSDEDDNSISSASHSYYGNSPPSTPTSPTSIPFRESSQPETVTNKFYADRTIPLGFLNFENIPKKNPRPKSSQKRTRTSKPVEPMPKPNPQKPAQPPTPQPLDFKFRLTVSRNTQLAPPPLSNKGIRKDIWQYKHQEVTDTVFLDQKPANSRGSGRRRGGGPAI